MHDLTELHLFRNNAFDEKQLIELTGLEGWQKDFTSCSIDFANGLYNYVLRYIQEHFEAESIEEIPGFSHHFSARLVDKKKDGPIEEMLKAKLGEEAKKEEEQKLQNKGIFKHNSFVPGLGIFNIKWKDETIYALHQNIGRQSGGGWNIQLFMHGRDKRVKLQTFLDEVVEANKVDPVQKIPDTYQIYKFDAYSYRWVRDTKGYCRSVESVVLPKKTKDELLEDIDEFLDEKNKAWYLKHGIPYKRCYLFYGIPGSGKTSLISVIAGLYDMSVCYLSPSGAGFNDTALRKALQNVPRNSLIIMEDIDALFTKARRNLSARALTFSGLLNALDGVGSGQGQIFIMLTNYRNRLDEALVRNGRVDKHIKFDYIKMPEAREMFKIFYEGTTPEQRKAFEQNLFRGIRSTGKNVSASTLQQFFIQFRKKTKDEAILGVEEEIVKIIRSNTQDDGNDDSISKEMIYS